MSAFLESHLTLSHFLRATEMVLVVLSSTILLETKTMFYIWWRLSTIERLAVSIQSDSNLWMSVTTLQTRKRLSSSSMTERYSRSTMHSMRIVIITHHTICWLEEAVILQSMITAIRLKAVILISLFVISGQMEQLIGLSRLAVIWEDQINSRCQQLKHFNSSSTDNPF